MSAATGDNDTPIYKQTARRAAWYEPQATVQLIRDIVLASIPIVDGCTVRLVNGETYCYRAGSSAVDDGSTVLQPTTGAGRWHRDASGGGGGASGLIVEQMELRAELEQSGAAFEEIDNSVQESFANATPTIEGFLMSGYPGSGTVMDIGWNPTFLQAANKNSNFVTYTGVTGTSTANIDSEGTTIKIGTSALSWDKTSGTVNSFVQLDLLAANAISVVANRFILAFINLPTISNVTSLSCRLSPDAADPANYDQIDALTQMDGSAFIVGWNLVAWDMDGTVTVAGTGFNPATQSLRTFAVGVVTATTTQVLTNIIMDSLNFTADAGETVIPTYQNLAQKGYAYTIADTSNQEQMIISSASARVAGNIALSAALANSYPGGTASAVLRSPISLAGANRSAYATATVLTGATLGSGAVTLRQGVRKAKVLKESLANANISTSVTWDSRLYYEVIQTPLSTTIEVSDPVNDTADLPSGAAFHVVSVYQNAGGANYVWTGNDIVTTSGSTHSAGVTTLTASSGDVTVVDNAGTGAVLVKKGQIEAFLSLVGATANESFSALTLDELVIEDVGLKFPKAPAVYGQFLDYGATELNATGGTTNRKVGVPGTNLGTAGSLNYARVFKNGRFGAGVFSDADYLLISPTGGAGSLLAEYLEPNSLEAGTVAFSFWIYRTGTLGYSPHILSCLNGAGTSGYAVQIAEPTGVIVTSLGGVGAFPTGGIVLPIGQWSHVALSMKQPGGGGGTTVDYKQWVNGVLDVSASLGSYALAVTGLVFGRATSGTGASLANAYASYLTIWSGKLANAEIGNSDVAALYAGGRHRILGAKAGFKSRFVSTSQAGQKMSVRADTIRTTTAVDPFITRIGAIKTN